MAMTKLAQVVLAVDQKVTTLARCVAASQTSCPSPTFARIFGTTNAFPNYPERFNIAPIDLVLTWFKPETGAVPRRAPLGACAALGGRLKIGARMINARAETVATMPAIPRRVPGAALHYPRERLLRMGAT
jgi:putative SOS response-associated peptidase YedK